MILEIAATIIRYKQCHLIAGGVPRAVYPPTRAFSEQTDTEGSLPPLPPVLPELAAASQLVVEEAGTRVLARLARLTCRAARVGRPAWGLHQTGGELCSGEGEACGRRLHWQTTATVPPHLGASLGAPIG